MADGAERGTGYNMGSDDRHANDLGAGIDSRTWKGTDTGKVAGGAAGCFEIKQSTIVQ